MEITVKELCLMYIEPMEEMTIYSIDDGVDVFSGSFDDAIDSEFSYREVQSFGIENGSICINI